MLHIKETSIPASTNVTGIWPWRMALAGHRPPPLNSCHFKVWVCKPGEADRKNRFRYVETMVDHVNAERRSFIMSSVRNKNTKPELSVRRSLHRLGYRYRIHRRDLPGSPDLVFPRRKKAIFVHGCFWHGHGCKWGQLPKSKLDYWEPKIEANRQRDKRNLAALRKLGWSVKIVWQCELRDLERAVDEIVNFLEKG